MMSLRKARRWECLSTPRYIEKIVGNEYPGYDVIHFSDDTVLVVGDSGTDDRVSGQLYKNKAAHLSGDQPIGGLDNPETNDSSEWVAVDYFDYGDSGGVTRAGFKKLDPGVIAKIDTLQKTFGCADNLVRQSVHMLSVNGQPYELHPTAEAKPGSFDAIEQLAARGVTYRMALSSSAWDQAKENGWDEDIVSEIPQPKNMEIRRSLVLSTAHISGPSAKKLADGTGTVCSAPTEFGWDIYTNHDDAAIREEVVEEIPELRRLFQICDDNDATHLVLDSDGPEVDGLPTWNW